MLSDTPWDAEWVEQAGARSDREYCSVEFEGSKLENWKLSPLKRFESTMTIKTFELQNTIDAVPLHF
jgi:hypothetical protein